MAFSLRRFITDNKLTTASRLDESDDAELFSDDDVGAKQASEKFVSDLNNLLRKHNIVRTEVLTNYSKGHMVFVNKNKDFLLVDLVGNKAVSLNRGK